MGAAAPVKKPTAQERKNAVDTFADKELLRRRTAAVAGLEALDATDNPDKGFGTYGQQAVYWSADQAEAKLQKRRRYLASTNTPDAADLAIRDLATGRARRARGGSSSSALGSFSPTKPMGADSILGGY